MCSDCARAGLRNTPHLVSMYWLMAGLALWPLYARVSWGGRNTRVGAAHSQEAVHPTFDLTCFANGCAELRAARVRLLRSISVLAVRKACEGSLHGCAWLAPFELCPL